MRETTPLITYEHDYTCMEAFREAVLSFEPFQEEYSDDLSALREMSDVQWQDYFSEYKDLFLETDIVCIKVFSNGFFVDDLNFYISDEITKRVIRYKL